MQKELDKNNIGIVLLAYNRPSHLQRLLISLQNSGIKKVSIYLDSPNNKLSIFNQKEILRMLNAAKFWLKFRIIKHKKHLGISKSIKHALDTEFKKYKKIILLEDDCVPFRGFFEFMSKSLNKFEYNNKIMSVCGYQLPFINKKTKTIKNFFLKRFLPWGWGTWRNRWTMYNESLSNIKKEISKRKNICFPDEIKKYLKNPRLLNNEADVWSINWASLHYLTNSFCIYPNISLIRNIGFDGSGVHCNYSNAFTVNNYEKYFVKIVIKNKIVENKQLEKNIEEYLMKHFSNTFKLAK